MRPHFTVSTAKVKTSADDPSWTLTHKAAALISLIKNRALNEPLGLSLDLSSYLTGTASRWFVRQIYTRVPIPVFRGTPISPLHSLPMDLSTLLLSGAIVLLVLLVARRWAPMHFTWVPGPPSTSFWHGEGACCGQFACKSP